MAKPPPAMTHLRWLSSRRLEAHGPVGGRSVAYRPEANVFATCECLPSGHSGLQASTWAARASDSLVSSWEAETGGSGQAELLGTFRDPAPGQRRRAKIRQGSIGARERFRAPTSTDRLSHASRHGSALRLWRSSAKVRFDTQGLATHHDVAVDGTDRLKCRNLALQTSSSQLRFLSPPGRIAALGWVRFLPTRGHSAAKLGLFVVAGPLLDYRGGPSRKTRGRNGKE